MGYRILLFDADGTLMDFKRAEAQGIEATFQIHRLPFDREILALYSEINRRCWEEFESGLLAWDALHTERFCRLFAKLGIRADAQAVQATYRDELGKGAFLMDGARELLLTLRKEHKIYIITNGVATTQRSRFQKCGLDQLVDGVFISEDIGCRKPQKAYFDHISAQIPDFSAGEALIIGDSLTADIQGGINAGIAVCWFNPEGLAAPGNMRIDHQIRRLEELKEFV